MNNQIVLVAGFLGRLYSQNKPSVFPYKIAQFFYFVRYYLLLQILPGYETGVHIRDKGLKLIISFLNIGRDCAVVSGASVPSVVLPPCLSSKSSKASGVTMVVRSGHRWSAAFRKTFEIPITGAVPVLWAFRSEQNEFLVQEQIFSEEKSVLQLCNIKRIHLYSPL